MSSGTLSPADFLTPPHLVHLRACAEAALEGAPEHGHSSGAYVHPIDVIRLIERVRELEAVVCAHAQHVDVVHHAALTFREGAAEKLRKGGRSNAGDAMNQISDKLYALRDELLDHLPPERQALYR